MPRNWPASTRTAVHVSLADLCPGWDLRFLREYYRTILLTKGTVILCAEKDGRMVGFVSGTLRAEERLPGLRRQRIRHGYGGVAQHLASSAPFPGSARPPRERSRRKRDYILQEGAHEEYWAWCLPGSAGALQLQLKWLAVLKTMGATVVRLEVDAVNELIEKVHAVCGARRMSVFTTPDGRERHILAYDLADKSAQKKKAVATAD